MRKLFHLVKAEGVDSDFESERSLIIACVWSGGTLGIFYTELTKFRRINRIS